MVIFIDDILMIYNEYIHSDRFEFEAGGELDGLKVAYHTSPFKYDPSEGKKVIWICHALTANSDAEDWWPELVGPGRLFDTEKYFVVCANMLGSPYGSSGPLQMGAGHYLDFPKVTVRDIVRANDLVRRHLGIGKVDLLVGGSIGGFQALEWSVSCPDLFEEVIFIACGAVETPWLAASIESQRMALEADANFRKQISPEAPYMGLRCARSIALISYRSYEGYNLTQEEKDEDFLFSQRAGSYQRYQGKKLSDRFDAYSYYYLGLSVDSHNVGRGRGGVERALSGIKAHTTVVGIDSDALFPVCEQKRIAAAIPGAGYYEITSRFGHDGFLLEYEQLTEIIEPLLANGATQRLEVDCAASVQEK